MKTTVAISYNLHKRLKQIKELTKVEKFEKVIESLLENYLQSKRRKIKLNSKEIQDMKNIIKKLREME